ncbi:PTS fructose-like transporter subunit IIB [Pasteurella canis]|nr:PTS fructose-like transporter subunit IIB [Pasteurella canis]
MNIFLTQKDDIGNSKLFLLHQVLTTAANQQSHQITELADADIIIAFSNRSLDRPEFVGKKIFIVDAEQAFNAPETTIQQAVTNATLYSTTESAVDFTDISAPQINRIVAVTACPTGVTQTFMSAEAIMNYAKAQGWQVKVETQGQVGTKEILTNEEIAAADLVFIATDIDINLSKFSGKLLYRTSTRAVLNNVEAEFNQALKQAAIYQVEQNEDVPTITPAPRNYANDFEHCEGSKKIVAVTACPTGVTQTFMSAEAIMNYAKVQGWCVKVETHGQMGSDNLISAEEIADADLVFVAADIDVDLTKFVGKPIYRTSTRAALKETDQEFAKAFEQAVIYTIEQPEEDIITPPARNFANDFATCEGNKKIVAITACPTGVTQTFMSAEAIMNYAKTQGWCVKVETHGQMGSDNLISSEEVEAADLVFVAADIDVDLTKFKGKPLYRTSTSAALKNTAQEFENAFAKAVPYTGIHTTKTCTPQASTTSECCQFKCKGAYLLPFILIGLIIALLIYFMS